MKPHCSKIKNHGLTLLEVLVIISVLALIAVLSIPPLTASRIEAERISCVSGLKEISFATRVWEGNHNDQYPMAVSCTNGGAMEQAATGNVAAAFQVMSNELVTPQYLLCPADSDRLPSKSFSTGFSANNISYFIGVSANERDPQMLLVGDDNFEIDGVPVKSGILELTTNNPVFWTNTRHKIGGNVAITDGSVQQLSTKGLQDWPNLATNRIAIP
jgi:competence protein ComGC